MGTAIWVVLFLGVVCVIVIVRIRKRAPLEYSGTLPAVPLQVSPEVFRERFAAQVSGNTHYFIGEMQSDTQFYMQYLPPGTVDKGWILLRGILCENKVRYEVKGTPIYQSEEFERNRLIGKLEELCAPNPVTR